MTDCTTDERGVVPTIPLETIRKLACTTQGVNDYLSKLSNTQYENNGILFE